MSSSISVTCDAPGCYAQFERAGIFGLPSLSILRAKAKKEGWKSGRVANPFAAGSDRRENVTVALDRCPKHGAAKLAVEIVDEKTYRIVERAA